MEQENWYKASVFLKTGQTLKVVILTNRTFRAESFTEETLQTFETISGTQVFVQGSNIAYLEVEAK
jgi:hypothetical protein